MASGRERFHQFMEETEQEQEQEKADDYDSDDPENWGPYYWSTDKNGNLQKMNASAKDKVVDNFKYYTFKASRGEVLVDFFGLNQSKYQWMIDQLEREQREEEEARMHFEQREELKRQKILEKEKQEMEALEGGT